MKCCDPADGQMIGKADGFSLVVDRNYDKNAVLVNTLQCHHPMFCVLLTTMCHLASAHTFVERAASGQHSKLSKFEGPIIEAVDQVRGVHTYIPF
jgi:hypothetical protein